MLKYEYLYSQLGYIKKAFTFFMWKFLLAVDLT